MAYTSTIIDGYVWPQKESSMLDVFGNDCTRNIAIHWNTQLLLSGVHAESLLPEWGDAKVLYKNDVGLDALSYDRLSKSARCSQT